MLSPHKHLNEPGIHYHGVRITGATGTNADLINGCYEPTEEMSGGICVYEKVDDNDTCLEYNDKLKKWQIKPVDCKGKPNCRASCKVPSKCLPEDCPVGEWVNGSTVQSTITIRKARWVAWQNLTLLTPIKLLPLHKIYKIYHNIIYVIATIISPFSAEEIDTEAKKHKLHVS